MIKKIFLAPMSHCDIGYTDFASDVRKKHVRYLREVVQLCNKTKGNPEGLKFKWTCESAWTVKEFLESVTSTEKDQFFYFVRNGQIEVTGFLTQFLSELASYEEIIRSLDYAIQLGKKNNFAVKSVVINDIGGYAWCLPEILSSQGIRYFVGGSGGFRVLLPFANLPHFFWWQSKGGGKILFWQIGHDRRISPSEIKPITAQYGFGDMHAINPYRNDKGRTELDKLLERLDWEHYPYEAILLQCAADNRGPDRDIVCTVESLNKDFPDIAFILSTPSEFFQYMGEKYKRNIPIYCGALTDPWSDHVGTMAKETSLYRKCQRQVAVLERLLAFSAKSNKKHLNKLQEIYENLLYYSDHTFGLSAWKPPAESRLVRSWKDKAAYLEKARDIIEREKKCMEDNLVDRAISEKINVSSSDISLGKNFIENIYYKIKFSGDGNVVSIFDKELKKELIDRKSQFAFNGLIFTEIKGLPVKISDVKGDGCHKVTTTTFASCSQKSRQVEKKGQTVEFKTEFELEGAPVKISGNNKIILCAGLKRIDFINTIYKAENRKKEALYFALPFNLKDNFKTYMEMAYNLLKFPDDLLPGSHSDFVAIQNFVSLVDKDIALTWVTLDAPLVEIGDIQTFKWAGYTYKPEKPTIFSYIMNNTWPTNCQLWQGGEFTFRYSLTSHRKFDPVQSYHFSQKVAFPDMANVEVCPDNVLLTGLHINEDKSLNVRLFEVAGKEGMGNLKWEGIKEAYLIDLSGRIMQKLPVSGGKISFPCFPHRLLSINLINR